MTRKEWISKHYPEAINEKMVGGVLGCPKGYDLLCRMDKSILKDSPCANRILERETLFRLCELCWNKEMEVSE